MHQLDYSKSGCILKNSHVTKITCDSLMKDAASLLFCLLVVPTCSIFEIVHVSFGRCNTLKKTYNQQITAPDWSMKIN